MSIGRPGVDVTICPLCGDDVHQIAVTSPWWGTPQSAAEIEQAVQRHLRDHHRLRLYIFRRTHWKWLIRGPL